MPSEPAFGDRPLNRTNDLSVFGHVPAPVDIEQFDARHVFSGF
jgi:hypothetical protein